MATLKNTTINGTDGLRIPKGTTAQRPASPVTGMLRYNENLFSPEFYNGSTWVPLLPTGSIEMFAGNAAPQGWLPCNGSAVARSTYTQLFAAIGTTWGAGNGSTTFNLPDLRGEFVRAADDGRGVDSGRGVGSFQDQDWKGFYQTNTGSNTFAYSHGPTYMGKTIFGTHTGDLFGGRWSGPAAASGTKWDTSEIRPRNATLNPCIKF